MTLTENASIVLRARYLKKDESGNIVETPEEMFTRVARAVAIAEISYGKNNALWEDRFFEVMSGLRFLPNSPTIMNAGKEMGQLAACFVLPVEDSMQSIFDTLKNAALILQSGGGTGFSFSHLRPKDDIVRSTGGIASGPVSFMKIYNSATDVIKQGGARRGANMGILRVDHPDILEFIRLKRNKEELGNFNISVAITDEFIRALRSDSEYDLVNPRTGRHVGKLKAKLVMDELVKSAWETGDPGVIFIDRVNSQNPTPQLGSFESTNPCGEQPLLPYEACVLGSLNLSKYVTGGKVDYEALARDVETCVRFLDDCIDINRYPLPEIEKMHKGNRKVGLGVMGWADMLIMLGVPYDSPRAIKVADRVMGFIQAKSKEVSQSLAAERGAFPNFPGSIYDIPGAVPLRNATLTTIAPTGTLSIIADCSSGIEPLFALAFTRHILDTRLKEINKLFFQMSRQRGFYSKDLEEKVLARGYLRGMKDVPKDIKRLFKTAHEITMDDHIKMQAAFQRHTDNAVSKTINIPTRAKVEDVEKAYLMAYDMGCKGITVFRYGSQKKGTMIKATETD